MSRVLTDGAETGDTSFFTSPSIRVSASTLNPGSGTYAYRGTGGSGEAKRAIATGLSEFYFKIRYSTPVGNGNYLSFYNNTTELLRLTHDTVNGRWNVTVATTGNTGNNSHPINTYAVVELHYKIGNAGGEIEIKIDGVSKFTFTGDTQPGSATTMDVIGFAVASGATCDFDDIALNNTAGGADNSWCGDGRVYALIPNGNGDSSQWVGSDGNSVNNYDLVEELPPSNTDYVQSSTTGHKDDYDLSSYTLLEGETVRRVWATALAKDTAAVGTLKLGMKTHSTDYVDTLAINTSFTRINSSEKTTNPNTGLAWTQQELDDLRVVIEMP